VALVEALDDSALALRTATLEPGEPLTLGDSQRDSLLYVAAGSGRLTLDDVHHELRTRGAGLVLAGEEATVATDDGLELVVTTVGPEVDRHAPLGRRATAVAPEEVDRNDATGARSFEVLLGPHNGSMRATLFAGFVPPGRAPWHYHLYDEIVWVPEGPGRLHFGDTTAELQAGSAFRLRPRQVHIVENASADRTMTVIGIFTPAGSPSAAYLTEDAANEYRLVG
jgi:quercetin dioxygenase-like cupin family protein